MKGFLCAALAAFMLPSLAFSGEMQYPPSGGSSAAGASLTANNIFSGSQTFNSSSGATYLGVIRGPAGNNGTPAFCSFADGCDSGLYFGTDQALMSAGGANKMTWATSGVTVGDVLKVTSGNSSSAISVQGGGDANTGFSWPNTDKIFMVANGAKAGQWGTDGLQVDGHVTASSITSKGQLGQGLVLSCSTGLTTTSTGAITGCAASDMRLKTDIVDMWQSSGYLIDHLKPRYYKWKKDQGRDDGLHAGFIAQEVQAVFPRAVVPAGKDTLGVDPNALIAVLVKEIQALRARVESLEKGKR